MKNNIVNIVLLLIIIVHLLILLKIVFFPYPELFIYSYLTSKGLLPYTQIIDQHFPGLMFFPVNLYSLGLNTPRDFQIINLVIVAANHILIFSISKKLFKSNFFSLLSNFLYLVWHPFLEGYVLWIDSFVAVILLTSFYLFLEISENEKPLTTFLAGFILGIALVFKQVALPLIFLISGYFLLIKRNISLFFKIMLGLTMPVGLMFLYILKTGVWKDFYYWTVVFNLTTFAQLGRRYPTFTELIKWGWIYGFSLLSVFLIKKYKNDLSKFHLLIIFFIGSLFFFFTRTDFIHLQPSLGFGIFLTIFFLRFIPKKALYTLLILYGVGSIYFLIPFYRWAYSSKGIMFFGANEQSISEEVRKYANVNDSVFAFATISHLNFLTDTLPPGKVFVFPFPWFMLKAEDKILDGLKKDPPKVVVMDRYSQVQGINLVSYMPNIKTYIENNYKVISSFEQTEVLIPK